MNVDLAGAGVGATAALGLITAVRWSPPMRRVRLSVRLEPYLLDAPRSSRLLAPAVDDPRATIARLLRPLTRALAGRVDRWVGGTASVGRRLEQAGDERGVEQFRVEQVVWAAGGLGVGLLLALLSAARGSRSGPIGFLIIAAVLAVGGVLAKDRSLTRRVVRREARMMAEFPAVAEMLALAVGAGESPGAALARVARSSRGELSRELTRALAEVRAGAPLVVALEAMAARTTLVALARFVDGMAIAAERGTPLADVLRAQASDVREQGRRALLESAGRKEIAMLVPVVFFVLPVTVVFALFPGFYSLRLAVP
jgi:tight adherence protein C